MAEPALGDPGPVGEIILREPRPAPVSPVQLRPDRREHRLAWVGLPRGCVAEKTARCRIDLPYTVLRTMRPQRGCLNDAVRPVGCDGQLDEEAAVWLRRFGPVDAVFRPDPDGPPLVVDFTLSGTPSHALNGGPEFKHSEAASISVSTHDQDETDRLWHALIADGGSESQCGWLKDRFGLSWQMVPEALPRLLASSDGAAAARAMQAMLRMRKIDIAALEAANAGETRT